MILIQAILILGIFYMVLRFISNPSSTQMRAWKKIIGIIFTALAVVVVLFPETANDIAHFVGVGRGADLLLYLLTLGFISVCINLYLKSKIEEQKMAKLARKVALLEAEITKKR
jgi:hypothetical protein